MTQVADAFWRDANHVPIKDGGVTATNSKTLSANNTTTAVPLFGITGSVLIRRLYGVVTTTLGTNQTAVYYRLNDQTSQTAMTAAAGSVTSNFAVGSTIEKRDLAAVAVDANNASAGIFEESNIRNLPYYQEFKITQKVGGIATNIEYVYSTNNQTSGAITFYCTYIPLTTTGNLTAL